MAEGQQAVIEVPARDVASESGPDTVDIEAVRPVLDEHQESILGRCRHDRRSATSDSCSTGDRRSVLQKLTPLQLRPPYRPAALAEIDSCATVMPCGYDGPVGCPGRPRCSR